MSTHRLIVDVDTGIDDSLALLYLLASPDAEIAGIAGHRGECARRTSGGEQSELAGRVPGP